MLGLEFETTFLVRARTADPAMKMFSLLSVAVAKVLILTTKAATVQAEV